MPKKPLVKKDKKRKQHRQQSNQSELVLCLIVALNNLGALTIDKGQKVSKVTKDFFKVGIFHHYQPDGNIEDIFITQIIRRRKQEFTEYVKKQNISITRWEHVSRWEKVNLLEDIFWCLSGNVEYFGEKETYGLDCEFSIMYGENFHINNDLRNILVKPITDYIWERLNGKKRVRIEKDELIYKCGEIIDEYNEQFSNKSQISDETNELLKELIKLENEENDECNVLDVNYECKEEDDEENQNEIDVIEQLLNDQSIDQE